MGHFLIGGVDEKNQAVNNFINEQFSSLKDIVSTLFSKVPISSIVGHRDLSPDKNNNGYIEQSEWFKECSCFEVSEWWEYE